MALLPPPPPNPDQQLAYEQFDFYKIDLSNQTNLMDGTKDQQNNILRFRYRKSVLAPVRPMRSVEFRKNPFCDSATILLC